MRVVSLWIYINDLLAGLKEEGVMFLLTDSQITLGIERFLIYINDLGFLGEIAGTFPTFVSRRC